MRRFEVKQRMFALGSKFDIINEYGDVEYNVQADFFDIGKNINVFNKNGVKVLYMKQIIRLGSHKYKIYDKNEIEIGLVNKELLVPKYKIEGSLSGIEMNATDILGRHYKVFHGDKGIGKLGKEVTFLRDEYYIESLDESYIELLIGLVVMIDMIKFNNKNNK